MIVDVFDLEDDYQDALDNGDPKLAAKIRKKVMDLKAFKDVMDIEAKVDPESQSLKAKITRRQQEKYWKK